MDFELKDYLSLWPRLFGSCPAIHRDEDGGGLDFFGSSGPDYGSGQLEHGLRQCQKPARYHGPKPQRCLLSNLPFNCTNFYFLLHQMTNMSVLLYPVFFSCFCFHSVFQHTNGYTESLRATCHSSTLPGLHIP